MTAPLVAIRSFLRQPWDLRVDPREVLLVYLDRIFDMERRGEAREESFYPHLLDLFEWYGEHRGRLDLGVTLIPRKTGDCLLDFQVRRGETIAGYVEAKRPGTDLDRIAGSEQLERYRRTFPNLLLTNFREFRLYRGETLAARAEAGRLDGGPERLLELFDLFVEFDPPPSASAASLARQLASRTRILAERIHGLLERDTPGEGDRPTSDLAGFYKAFSEYLLAGLGLREFADLYAQTLSYGLLAARWRVAGEFGRRVAAESIPPASGILRDVFRYISLAEPPPEIGWIVDEIVALLAAAPVRSMLERYFHGGRGRDPVLDFYQTFLQCYDPALRKRRGVYYTPPELVSFVVRSVDRLLRTRLGKRHGLATPGVSLLDPAAGTLTFVVEAIRCAAESVRAEMGGGGVPALLGDHLLRDFHAFELMMAPYAIGHLKMSLILEEMGRPLGEGERFHLYLTNALERGELEQSSLPGMATLSRESHEAGRVKKELAVTVILGNPPWSGHSANRGGSLDALPREGYTAADGRRIEGYYQVDGEPLGERNPKWLQDDYVKFLRFAQRKIDEAGEGIVAFVTNHSYLDNPTFRGLRRSLMTTFDEIYVLDLHGNGKKKERSAEGGVDASVFEGVFQGAAVAFLVKKPGLAKRVLRADLRGSRAAKLGWLSGHDVETAGWAEASPQAPAFLFAPRDAALEEEYGRGVPLTEIFPERSVGIVTGRDAFAVDTDPSRLRRRIRFLREAREAEILPDAPRQTATWRIAEAMRRARADAGWEERFVPILYRPFDRRTIFYADYVIERARDRVMRHMRVGRNLGLVVPRQHKEEPGALVTDAVVAHKAVSAYDINTLFPLYLYPEEGRLDGADRAANVAPGYLRLLASRLGEEPSPELVLQFVYAVLYSPAFRRRYAGLLRADFPRIPTPADRGAFLELAGLGAVLIDLHLLRSDRLDHPGVRFEGAGSGKVTRRAYHPAERRIVVNGEGQRFEGIEPEVWAYRVGGYQVLDQWLAARTGRPLRLAEIEELRRIAAALRETMRVERRIEEVGGEPRT
ncbi:MAG TPA: type ISP restriction/modification enzyme [Thermoanaerobaculia bacterium]|nr:type ISP restriction/modification enzyme [Thermoanaerobaculia bacterium]